MYDLLLKLIVGACVLQLGKAISEAGRPNDRWNLTPIFRAGLEATRIEWHASPVFPSERQRFKEFSD